MARKKKPSSIWYLLPIFLGIIGGLIGYLAVKDRDEKMARNLIVLGAILSAAGIILGLLMTSAFLYSSFNAVSGPSEGWGGEYMPEPGDTTGDSMDWYPTVTASGIAPLVYTSSAYGFSVEPPEGWEYEEYSSLDDGAVSFSPDMDADVPVLYSVDMGESSGLSLSEIAEAGKAALEETFGAEVVEDGPATIGGIEAYYITTSLYLPIFEDSEYYRSKQYVFLSGSDFFVITYSAFDEAFDTYLPDFEGSISTFRTV